MKKKTKTALKITGIVALALGVLTGGAAGYLIVKDKQAAADYIPNLNAAGIFSPGQDAEHPRPITCIAELLRAHFTAPLPEGKTQKKALLIGLDGLRADGLENLTTADESGILTLKAQGGLYPIFTGGIEGALQDTSTAPGWASMLTGTWALEDGGHGVLDNGDGKGIEPKTVLTELLEGKKMDSAAFLVSWDGHLESKKATYAAEAAYTKEQGLAERMRWETFKNDDGTFAAASAALSSGDDTPDLTFLILEYGDHTGHTSGFGNKNPRYREAVRTADAQAKRLLDIVAARENYTTEDWLLLIATDHGGTGLNHGGQSVQERNIFLATNQALPD
ncbi:MAG: alkaline phosphatase family protein [Oscillospiraceae bacterium]|jgi:predicted AlkP superfamily pyrophosphatase or phosphodiesterase|nr:alkaline phosphatase family protein [Oscillospiraceae bacterium]